MAWKEGYTITDEVSPDIVEWPNGYGCAANFVVDYSPPNYGQGISEGDIDRATAVFGTSVTGQWLIPFLKSHQIQVTFSVPALMARKYPDFVKQIKDAGHEVASGSWRKADDNSLSREKETAQIQETTEILEKICGTRPWGWYSLPRFIDQCPGGSATNQTMSILRGQGYLYFGNSMADDIPHYWVDDFEQKKSMLALPYYYHADSQFFIFFPGIGRGTGLVRYDDLRSNLTGELQGAYRFKRQFTMVFQPHLLGTAGARSILEDLIREIKNKEDIWLTTSENIARHWARTYPADTYLNLEESAWTR